MTFWNKRAGTLVIQKKDSVSGALISGAQFQLNSNICLSIRRGLCNLRRYYADHPQGK